MSRKNCCRLLPPFWNWARFVRPSGWLGNKVRTPIKSYIKYSPQQAVPVAAWLGEVSYNFSGNFRSFLFLQTTCNITSNYFSVCFPRLQFCSQYWLKRQSISGVDIVIWDDYRRLIIMQCCTVFPVQPFDEGESGASRGYPAIWLFFCYIDIFFCRTRHSKKWWPEAQWTGILSLAASRDRAEVLDSWYNTATHGFHKQHSSEYIFQRTV